MRERNIALIGFRATGKSTVGKILAGKLDMRFIDMDQRLCMESGRDIATWVKQDGWGSFRRAESGLLEIIGLQKGVVLATGGGIILDAQNRGVLRKDFFTVWLKATPQTIYARLRSDPCSPLTRPALSELPVREEIETVLSEREPLYSEVANIEIDTEGKEAVAIADEIGSLMS
ncbi:Shikimate kinase [Syntrophobacter sp. SbD1]|nr:Shikimate kinase [Syntrophobacter sp. SbD1]